MRFLFLPLFFLLLYTVVKGQIQCGCAKDTSLNGSINCDVIHLKNGAKLYYQFNCDSSWLTLKNRNGKEIVLCSLDSILMQYNYRIGYQLSKEYKNALLFRSGCPANGPCNFILINKNTGKKISELGELIYNHNTDKFYDFIIYFSSKNILTIHYINSGKKYSLPIDTRYFNELIPEYDFDKVFVKKDILTLTYSIKRKTKWIPSKLSYDLKKHHLMKSS